MTEENKMGEILRFDFYNPGSIPLLKAPNGQCVLASDFDALQEKLDDAIQAQENLFIMAEDYRETLKSFVMSKDNKQRLHEVDADTLRSILLHISATCEQTLNQKETK